MISIHVKEVNGKWFGLACAGDQMVATSIGPTRRLVLENISRCLPAGAKRQIIQQCSAYVEKAIRMLADLEEGDERGKSFSLACDYVAEPLAKVLKIAASIPIGYVTSYGNIAEASDSDPRAVGRIMSTNPLYPIVPCHRVVGADLSLVGYRGRKDAASLRAKLDRLRRESRGHKEAKEVTIEGGKLRVYPVEWAIRKAEPAGMPSSHQMRLFDQPE